VTLLGATVAIVLARLCGLAISWPPPSRDPILAHLYPTYLIENINENSFPSESTALYAAIAAGVSSLNRQIGAILFVLVVVVVSLPRVFVGGHYPTDIFAGLILGLAAYFLADALPDAWFHPLSEKVFEQASWLRVLGEFVVFVWISQIGVEFAEFVWVKNALERIWKGGG
jgi:membrane-associated phospholipid phosphatase